MSEFSPICISFVISSLVSLILLGLPFVWPILFSFIGQHEMPRSIPFLFLGSIVLLFYLLCLKVGLLEMFWELLSRTGNLLVNRALSPFLLKIGCSSDLALLIGFLVKALLAAGQATLFMSSSGANEGAESATSSSQQPSNDSSSAPSSSSVGASSGASSGVDQAPGSRDKSALDQRKDELLIEKLKERKGDVGDGQRISDVRKTVETEFNVKDKGDEFEFIKQMEKETEAKKEDRLVTHSAFNEVKEYESKIQDGRGGI